MTDEEKADKWVKHNCCEVCVNKEECDLGYINCFAKLAYLAGRPKWHNLRKDPNDLPDNDRVVSDQEGTNVRYVKFRDKWFYLDRTTEANIIAWCEIPQYKE